MLSLLLRIWKASHDVLLKEPLGRGEILPRTLEGGMACWEERNLTQDSALQGVEGVLPLVELELLDRDHGA